MTMRALKSEYLIGCGTAGGTAAGFRDFVRRACESDPRIFPVDFLRDEAATKAWQAKARTIGPDLFSLNGLALPEFLTRQKSAVGFVDDEDAFEKVATTFATVNDLYEDAIIKMRNAARSSAAAEERMKQADEARRRARGLSSAFLRDIKD